MTFSLVVRDAATGAFGSVISSSSPAVAARCVHLRDGVGGVHSQNVTDPRLGPELLDLLEQGRPAGQALAELVAAEPAREWRQLLVVDAAGGTAVHSGGRALGVVGEHRAPAAAAAGNMLATPDVPRRLVEGFLAATGSLERRLLAAYEAAMAEGGEAGPVHSAGLSVVDGSGWRVTDLRVDWSEAPLPDLRALLDVWEPQRDDYVTRALDPDGAPGYGVPGDDR
ncbi:DUF1028 domain-containing protein [Kineococcus rhizosphaerae]|uniref:Putative Ntn-hydrolase superfamily protein n=1 Tax=Kineococcus rhizosphaerae TaxID=559628 RepID=A0A2T0R249_9ACTN|nr:DUF1028 domain-containing protein [Kineococcus rhizosphaerae]PRY13626.1 putative Ntn-hydrolase superfamily protein [Kineococcus rhizosphaerae]